jgi:hypothetical protein
MLIVRLADCCCLGESCFDWELDRYLLGWLIFENICVCDKAGASMNTDGGRKMPPLSLKINWENIYKWLNANPGCAFRAEYIRLALHKAVHTINRAELTKHWPI